MNRRSFVTKTILTGSGIAFGSALVGCKDNKITEEAVNPDWEENSNKNLVRLTFENTHVRQPVHTLNNNSDIIIAYRDSVKQMKKMPGSNPFSWEFQASIHLNHCVHSNWFFLPWHRAYLYYFESICRKLSSLTSFALPYWDWTEFPQIPEQFWGEPSNPLNNNTRRINETSTASAEFIGNSTLTQIMGLKDFDSFGSHRNSGTGELEGTPHNYVHNFVSGNMVTMMSPLDPIFWCHHANVDRIWSEWNANGNGNPASEEWNNHAFDTQFYDSEGKATKMKVSELTSTRQLDYTYQSNNNNILQVASTNAVNLRQELSIFKGSEFSNQLAWIQNPITLNQNNLKTINAVIETKEENKQRIKIKIKGITPPENEDFFVRIFINCPYLTKNTPINDPNYIGSFCFFGTEHALHKVSNTGSEGLEYIFDITNKYKTLVKGQVLDTDVLDVQLITVPFDESSKTEFEIQPSEIELIIT